MSNLIEEKIKNARKIVIKIGSNTLAKPDGTQNTEFMTNGDVPILAVQDLIDNPVNPFTGNVLTCQDKIDNNILIAQVPDKNLTALKIAMSNAADYTWWSVKGDIFDKRNWVKLSE